MTPHPHSTLSPEQHAVVAELARGFGQAFNARDGEALAALFTDDAEFVNIFAARFRGRAAIASSHAAQFASVLRGNLLVVAPEEADITGRALTPDLLLAHVAWRRDRLPDAAEGSLPPGEGLFTFVVERRAGQWRLAATTNVQRAAPPVRK